jgi:YHS domain-containing protein
MKRKYFFATVLSVLISASHQMALAHNTSNNEKTESEVSKPQNIGNKICPVTSEKIGENSKVTYEYRGKIYNLCCSACIKEFRNNPDKYIRIIEQEKNK